MKTIVVVSDTHGRKNIVDNMMPIFSEADYIIHLGDGARDMTNVSLANPLKTYVCKGNCDYYTALDEWVLEVEGVRIFMCHGDRYRVKSELDKLVQKAKELDCTVALYGHTHLAEIRNVDGVLCVNPGSLQRPVDYGGTYAYITIGDGKAYPIIVGDES